MQLETLPLFELKASAEGLIEGIASSFGRVDSYGDTIAPGAYAATLAEHKAAGRMPAMLWAHRMAEPVGRWTKMTEAPAGLHVVGQLNMRTDRGAQAFEHLRGGDVSGLSVGYSIPKGGDEVLGTVRVLKRIELHEVSLVTLPADQDARISSVKNRGALDDDDLPLTLREFERLLHSLGFSKARAAFIAKHGFRLDPEPDPEDELDPVELQAAAARLQSFALALKGHQP